MTVSPRITILDEQTANRIAAGEVVERPASVIKELVENTIDAGSTAVTIEIRQGGIEYIRVTDNGCGIVHEDAATAFMRHATSKIISGHSLHSIATMGFRGEALSSIAAVSRVELITRTKTADNGTKVEIEGGKLISTTETGCPEGTTFIARDLFYNTPARRKFIKPVNIEAGYVADLVTRLALCNPAISFRFIRDGVTLINTPGDGSLKSTIHAIYGRETVNTCQKMHTQNGNINMYGYISLSEGSRPNRTWQTLALNGRYIKSTIINAAITDAYGGLLMTRRYPMYVLHINIDLDEVDVNVHPNKLEVRFGNEKLIYDAVFSSVSDTLSAWRMPAGFIDTSEKSRNNVVIHDTATKIEEPTTDAEDNVSSNAEKKLSIDKIEQIDIEDFQPITVISDNKPSRIAEGGLDITFIGNTQLTPQSVPEQVLEVLDGDIKIAGQLFDTYILVEQGGDAFIIDQHAAHERILYEQYKKQLDSGVLSQQLAVPYVVQLGYIEYETVIANAEQLQKLGFDVEPFGNTSVLIHSVPMVLGSPRLSDFITELSEGIRKNKNHSIAEDEIISMACKAAVKAGMHLSEPEIRLLLNALKDENMPLSCPHGRPVLVRMSKRELEKRFKRVL